MVYQFHATLRSIFFLAVVLLTSGATLGLALLPQNPGVEAAGAQSKANTPPDSVVLYNHTVAMRVPAKPGDICLQCGHAIGMHDPVYEVNGHRMPLHLLEMEQDLGGQLQRLLGSLEPSGAFLQAASRQTGLSPGWFLFGCYVLLGLIFAALCAHRALHKGLPAWTWFLAGLLLNVVAFAVLLFRPAGLTTAPAGIPAGLHKISSTYAPVACVKCGDLNHPSAHACAGCGTALKPAMESEVTRAGLPSA
jgi:hypothetical protein